MIHDVWPLRFREALAPWKRLLYRLSIRQALAARRIVTPSTFSRDEIVALLGADPGRVRVVRQGAPPLRTDVEPRRPAGLPDGPFALTVGLNYPYKNLGIVVDAWARLRQSAPLDLVAAGRELERYPTVRELAQQRGARRVTALGHVSESELEWLYRHATLLLFPSTYEGFGFPMIEAFQRGLPVIGSDIPALRELNDGSARLVPPDDASAWAAAVDALAGDADARRAMAERGRARAGALSYAETARALLEVLREALAGR
jgi:alpha-1,3-rhamnosyl/mannosyltransferase